MELLSMLVVAGVVAGASILAARIGLAVTIAVAAAPISSRASREG